MWLKIGILVAVNLFFYGRTLSYGMIIDDVAAFNARIERKTPLFWKNLWLQFRQHYIESPELGHLFSIIMHMINTLLVFFLFKQTDIAFLTAVLFCINPVGNMASTWLSGRTYSIATTMVLIGFNYPLLFPIIYPFTLGWSISTFFAPLLLVFGDYQWMVLLLPLVAWFGRKRYMNTIKLRLNCVPKVMKTFNLMKLILVFKTFSYYFCLCLFPWKLGMCPSVLHSYGLSDEETEKCYKLDLWFWSGVILFTIVSAIIIYLPLKVSFGLIWFLVFSAQWYNWIVINHPITSRYMYLANIGIMYFIAQFIINTPFMWIFLTLYAVLNLKYIPAYRDCLEYWKSNVNTFPDVAMGYNQYGLELQSKGKVGTAFDVWLQGLKVRPQDFRISFNISKLLAEQGRWDIIKEFLVTAEKGLDKNNNYEFWEGEVTKLKTIAEGNGVRFNVSKEQEEADKKQKDLDNLVAQQEINDVNSVKNNPFLNIKYKPDYLKHLSLKYKVKLEGVDDGTDLPGSAK